VGKKPGKKKGSRKIDRNRKWCEAYRLRGQREINKAKRLARHIKRFPQDVAAANYLKKLAALAKRAKVVAVAEPQT